MHKLQALGESVTDEAVAALTVPPHKPLAFDVSAEQDDDEQDDDLSDLNEYPVGGGGGGRCATPENRDIFQEKQRGD